MANVTKDLWDGFKAFTTDGFKYNLQVFPDTLTAATFLFSILFQSPPLAAFTASIVTLNFLHPLLATFLSQIFGGFSGTNTDVAMCSGRFPGVSFGGLMNMARERSFGALNFAATPSYYSVFLGFVLSYLSAMPVIYAHEFDASPKRKAITITGLVVLSLVVVLGMGFRLLSGCDTFVGLVIGILIGAVIGILLVGLLAWGSDRRLTNLLGFPLMRNRAEDGKPIYVCERPTNA